MNQQQMMTDILNRVDTAEENPLELFFAQLPQETQVRMVRAYTILYDHECLPNLYDEIKDQYPTFYEREYQQKSWELEDSRPMSYFLH